MENIILFTEEQEIAKSIEESPEFLAEQAQSILSGRWGYVSKKAEFQCPDLTEEFKNHIENYESKFMISSEAEQDKRTNYGIALLQMQDSGDFIILYDKSYGPSFHVNKSRNLGFSFSGHENLLIVYFPESGRVDYTSYTVWH